MVVLRTAKLSLLVIYIAGCNGFIGGTRERREGLPTCNPPLTLSPEVAVVAPLALVKLSASGGRGEYAFDISDNASGAHINPDDGSYLAGATTGVRDRIRVTAAECEGEAVAIVEVPQLLVVQPGTASVPPGTSFAMRASMGSGSFTYEVHSTVSGAVITPAGVYTAGPRTGVDVVRVTDSVTKTTRDATIQVSFDAVLQASPAHIALPVGSRTTLHVRGGSGHVSADADGIVSRFQDGMLEALAPGSQTLTVT
ncbi:MAG TPA: hypothetical protein VLC93_12175, partial [Myxococcota bacterium]|nr:hypothetical protein [Myxococcota bacterium]